MTNPMRWPAVERPRDLPDPSVIRGMVAVDTETTGLYVDDGAYTTVVSVAYRTDEGIFLHAYPFAVGDPEGKGFTTQYYKAGPYRGKPKGDPEGRWIWDDPDVNLTRDDWYDLRKWLVATGKTRGHVYQNAKFDLHMLRAGAPHSWPGVELAPYVKWDTMLASVELFPGESSSLKPTCARIWGAEAVEEAAEQKEALAAVKLRYGLKAADGPRYDLVPWSVLESYAAADAALTLQLAEHQGALFDEGHADQTQFERAMRLMRVLYAMERRGFGPYDVERSKRISHAMATRISQLTPIIAAEFGILDDDAVMEGITLTMAREHFFDKLGFSPWGPGDVPHGSPDPKTGKPRAGSCGVSVVRRMAAAGAPGAAEYAEYLELTSARRMFYENYAELAGPDWKLRTGFRQAYVRSGRMSVERFQAQAMPKHLGITLRGKRIPEPRELFGVDPGRVRVNLDLTQAELRIAAKFSGCSTMIEALESGADFHGLTTTKVFGITDSDPEWSAKRDIAKRLTFGSIFMVGGQTFRNTLYQLAGINWPLGECAAAVKAWRQAYPEFGESYEYWQHVASMTKRVELYDGTFSWMLGPQDYPNTAWNRRVQGSLARWVNYEWLPFIEARTAEHEALVLTVHDSVVLDLPEAAVDEVVADIQAETSRLWLAAFGISGGCDRSEFAK